MNQASFFNRDISWLSFNGRVLDEAGNEQVPLLERIKFLAIYSSNLDEFYRVRMPAILALQKIARQEDALSIYREAVALVNRQQERYGQYLETSILPALKKHGIRLLYNETSPLLFSDTVRDYFFTQVAGFLQPKLLAKGIDFFPENNQLYLAAVVEYNKGEEKLYLINIPTGQVPRFLKVPQQDAEYLLFLEDIIKAYLSALFPGATVKNAYNIKITRDAELDLQDEYEEDLAEKIEKQLSKRDFGYATRFLYEPGIPLRHLQTIVQLFNFQNASVVEGGKHHNLKDFASLPLRNEALSYPAWPDLRAVHAPKDASLFDMIAAGDRMIHAPYQSYDSILRFFNEAAIDPSVEEIYTTLYRVASQSRIVQALISAAKNGRKVSVLVELKARFDEANNIRWAKQMKAAGIKIIYSNNALKVHAKIALVKRKHPSAPYLGLLATGNLNETTAHFYTDHILLTAHRPMLEEMETLFLFLAKRKRPDETDQLTFQHLLVAQFNLQQRFLQLVDREIANAGQGLSAAITIKLNNLEEEVLINKLYEASRAGVTIRLIVRSICRLVPGVKGQSENISIKRIVDRYLEHGRVFIFHNNGSEEIYLGSADWMNRNIYRRIEVCFPLYDAVLREELRQIIHLQWQDNVQAVWIDADMNNRPVEKTGEHIRSQEAIRDFLAGRQQKNNIL